MARFKLEIRYQDEGWKYCGLHEDDLEKACGLAWQQSQADKTAMFRVVDSELNYAIETYSGGQRLKGFPHRVDENELTPEFARALLDIYDRYGDLLRKLAGK